jgi:hypothetical protein
LISILSDPSGFVLIAGNAARIGVGGEVMKSAPNPVNGACTLRTSSVIGARKPSSRRVFDGWNLLLISR